MLSAMLGYGPPASFNLLQSRAARELGLAERAGFVGFLPDLPARIEEAMSWF